MSCSLVFQLNFIQSQQIKRSNRLYKGCESLSHESDHSGKNQYNLTTIESNNDGLKKLILLTKERSCWNNAAQRYENSFYRN